MSYTNEQILDLYIIHGECQRIIERTCRTFNNRYPHVSRMTGKKFRKLWRNFLSFGNSNPIRRRSKNVVGNETNVINVLGYFYAYPRASIPSTSEALGIKLSSVHRILREHKFHPFKFIKVQCLQPADEAIRKTFCENILIRIQEDPHFLKKIIWSDEAKFGREGGLNSQNDHHWSDINPMAKFERGNQDKFSLNVFAIMKDNKLEFELYDGNLNSERYVEILNSTLRNFLDEIPISEAMNCWFQLDGAPPHCTRTVSQILEELFEDRWIRRLGPWHWPARSPDLTPLDFFLWGYVKSEVYKVRIANKSALRNRIIEVLRGISPELLRKATMSVEQRILKCLEVNGSHFEHLI